MSRANISPVWTDPDRAGGQPCVRGTRIPVETIWNYGRAGYDTEAIAREYPTLTVEQIDAVLGWVPDMVTNPPHYTSHPSGVECIDIVEHFPLCIGNAIKYLWRAGLKGDTLRDLRKARWYVDRAISSEVKKQEACVGAVFATEKERDREEL